MLVVVTVLCSVILSLALAIMEALPEIPVDIDSSPSSFRYLHCSRPAHDRRGHRRFAGRVLVLNGTTLTKTLSLNDA